MKVLYDIDLDFFYDGERPLAECLRPKPLAIDPGPLLEACRHVPCALHVEHGEALAAWEEAGLEGWECWHFDAHPDLGAPGGGSPLQLPLGRRADHVHLGNFLITALREGILSSVRWVLPPLDDRAVRAGEPGGPGPGPDQARLSPSVELRRGLDSPA
ncbi:MAG: UPF0489 family protein [Deltaproteobacteria bacterium]|nr:UPF0489 family protein [Deltaproteobacteria bacterium]